MVGLPEEEEAGLAEGMLEGDALAWDTTDGGMRAPVWLGEAADVGADFFGGEAGGAAVLHS